METSKLPTIRLMLGDSLEVIRQQSTYPFPIREMTKIDIVSSDKPATFEYVRPGGQFTLPPARSFGAAINDGHAVSVTIAPQLQYLSLDEALRLIEDLGRRLKDAKWTLAKRYLDTDQVRARFMDASRDSDYTVRVEEWRFDGDETYVELSRHWRKGDSAIASRGQNEDLFLVTLEIENDSVRKRYSGLEQKKP